MFLVILIGVCLTLTCYLFTHQHFVGSGFFGLLTVILSGVSSGISTTNAIWFTITWIVSILLAGFSFGKFFRQLQFCRRR